LLVIFAAQGVFGRRGDEAAGHAQIRKSFETAMHTHQAMLHTPESHDVTLAGPDETAAWASGQAEPLTRRTAILAYRYADTQFRVEGRWRFSRLRVRFIYAVSATEHGSGICGPNRKRWPGVEHAPADYPENIDFRAASRS
jgi:hypothetical protein